MHLVLIRLLSALLVILALYFALPRLLPGVGDDARMFYAGFAVTLAVLTPMLRQFASYRRLSVALTVWVVAFATIVGGYSHRAEIAAAYQRALGRTDPVIALARAPGEIEITRTWDGHFRALASIGGGEVGLLIDTGASIVLLRYEDAEAIGIDMTKLDFSTPITTANGGASIAPITLKSVRIGNVELRDVRAGIAQRGALYSGLLGMSFLNALSEVSFRGDKVILKN